MIPQGLLVRRSPGYLPAVVQLDAVLDPGGWLYARLYRTHHVACAHLKRIGTHPKFAILGAMGQIQGYFPFTALLSFVFLSGLRLRSLNYYAAD